MEYIDYTCKGVAFVKTIIDEWKVCFGDDKKYTHALEKLARLESTMAHMEGAYAKLRKALLETDGTAATTSDPLAVDTTHQYLVQLMTTVESALLNARDDLGVAKDFATADVMPAEKQIAAGKNRLLTFTKHLVHKIFDKSPIEKIEQMMDKVLIRINDAMTIITHAHVERIGMTLERLDAKEDARDARITVAVDDLKKALAANQQITYEHDMEISECVQHINEMSKFTEDSVTCVVGLARNIDMIKMIATENLTLSHRIYDEVGARYGRSHVRLPAWVVRGPVAYALIVLTIVGAVLQICSGATLWSYLNTDGADDPCDAGSDCVWSVRVVCLIAVLYGAFAMCVAICEFLWVRFRIDIIVLCLRRWVIFVSTSAILLVATLFALKSVWLAGGRVDPAVWLCVMIGYVLAPIGLIRA